jgi:hypothetical protein
MLNVRRFMPIVAAITIGIIGASVSAPAYAADDVPTSGPSDGGVGLGVTNLPALPAPEGGGMSPSAAICDAAWSFDVLRNYGNVHTQVGPAQYNRNDTGSTASTTFTSQVAGTVGITVTGSTEVNGGIFVASVKSSLNIALTASATVTVGNSITAKVPPRSGVYASYGVWRLKVDGHNYYTRSNCTETNSTNPTVFGPRYVGWRIWAG